VISFFVMSALYVFKRIKFVYRCESPASWSHCVGREFVRQLYLRWMYVCPSYVPLFTSFNSTQDSLSHCYPTSTIRTRLGKVASVTTHVTTWCRV